MPKRALDEDECIDGGSDEAASMLPASVIISSSNTELGVKDDEEEDVDADRRSECSAVMESSASDDTSLLTDGSTDAADPCSKNRVKKSVSFDDVTVYYFPRVQGFTCVPSQGGSTLGMGDQHMNVQKYSLSEHAQLRRSLHHEVLLEHQRQGRIFLPENFSSRPAATEWAVDEYYFLQPVPARQRRAMLHEAGVVRIDPTEREECRSLRLSRGRCGCSCREVCRPPSCACCRSGIGCQVDQMAFPCSCSRSGCANPYGRVEFNAARVRAHFIRTLLQLGLEQNATTEYDVGICPPAKRCRTEDDHLPASLSSSFSSSSSPSLFVSSCVDSTSVSATNGFEPETVHFHSAELLPGPESMAVAYDEECDEDGEESSSETSSDSGASFDGMLNDVGGCGNAGTLHDARQSTLDNYVVRFSRQHAYTDPAASRSSIGSFVSGLQLSTVANSSFSASLSKVVRARSLPGPFAGLRMATTYGYSLSDNTAHVYSMPSVTTHDSSVCCLVPSNSYSASHTQGHYTTHDTASCAYPVSNNHTSVANSSLSASLSKVVRARSLPGPFAGLRMATTYGYSLPDNTAHVYSMPSVTRHDSSLCCLVPSNSCSASHTQGHYTTNDTASCAYPVSDNHTSTCFEQQQTAVGTSTQCSAVCGCVVSCSSLTSSVQQGTCIYSTACNTEGEYSILEDAASSCSLADNTSGYSVQENSIRSSRVADSTDSYDVQYGTADGLSVASNDRHNYCFVDDATFPNYITSVDDTSHSLPENARNNSAASNDTAETAQVCCTEQETIADYPTQHDNTCNYSMQRGDALDCCTTNDNTYELSDKESVAHSTQYGRTDDTVYNDTVSNSARNSSTADAVTQAHFETVVATCELSKTSDETVGCYTVTSDECFVFHDVAPSHFISDNTVIHGCSQTDNVAYDCVVPHDSCSCIVDDTTPDHATVCLLTENNASLDDIIPDIANSCLLAENGAHTDDRTDDTIHDDCMPNNTDNTSSNSHCSTTFKYSATDTDHIMHIHSYSMSENDTGGGCVPDNVDSGSVPRNQSHGSGISENTGNSCCEPDYTMNSSSIQQNSEPSSFAYLKCNDSAVMAVTMPIQLVQNGSCLIADSDSHVSGPRNESCSDEIRAGNETVSESSETLDYADSVTDDTALEHAALHPTVTRCCTVSQLCSVTTVSCALSSEQNSAAEPDGDTIAAQKCSHIAPCSVHRSFSDSQTVLTTMPAQPSSVVLVTDQRVAAINLLSDFQNTSQTSCHAEDSENTLNVGTVTSSLNCLNDDKSHTVSIALDNVSAESEISVSDTACRDTTGVVLAYGISELTSATDCHFDHKNYVDAVASDPEATSDSVYPAVCVDSSYSTARDHCDNASTEASDVNVSAL